MVRRGGKALQGNKAEGGEAGDLGRGLAGRTWDWKTFPDEKMSLSSLPENLRDHLGLLKEGARLCKLATQSGRDV